MVWHFTWYHFPSFSSRHVITKDRWHLLPLNLLHSSTALSTSPPSFGDECTCDLMQHLYSPLFPKKPVQPSLLSPNPCHSQNPKPALYIFPKLSRLGILAALEFASFTLFLLCATKLLLIYGYSSKAFQGIRLEVLTLDHCPESSSCWGLKGKK